MSKLFRRLMADKSGTAVVELGFTALVAAFVFVCAMSGTGLPH
jgi:Flp pilus assembly pilin Flp